MPIKPSVLIRSAMISIDELRRDFSVPQSLRILLEVNRRNRKGFPFHQLAPTDNEKEAATRRELASTVNLFHVLAEKLGEERAYSVARRIILNSSLIHLRSIYPDFTSRSFVALGKRSSDGTGKMLGAEFPFADTKIVELVPERASFDVTVCRIPQVLSQVNASRLAPIFCEVDSIYFPIFEPDVELRRTQTIIRGGSHCDFRFTWRV